MSDLNATMPAMSWHPWRLVRSLPHIDVRWERMAGLLGHWDQDEQAITLHPDQSQRQKRVTLTHEMIHAERGHRGECDEKVERQVARETARRLIPIHALVDAALAHEDDHHALCDALWVDLPTLQIRLASLHPSERGYLTRRLSMKEASA